MFSLHDYQTVVAISEEGHFGRAARRLSVTQPALSSRLRRIEEDLGVRLFNRDRGGVSATPAGLQFVEGSEHVIAAAEDAAQAARNAASGLGQTLRIGMTQIAAHQIVVETLAAFRTKHPHARVKLVEGTTASLERRLEQGGLDLAFVHPPIHSPDLVETNLLECPVSMFDAAPGSSDIRPPIAYPRNEAPVLMGMLARKLPLANDEFPAAEADTILGAFVLSRAGFGPFPAPEDFPLPVETSPDEANLGPIGVTLETAIVRRALDRRPMVTSIVHCAVEAAH